MPQPSSLLHSVHKAFRATIRAGAFAAVTMAALCALPHSSLAQETPAAGQTLGSVSNLPVPRYVSLKSDRVNLRAGPGKDHRTLWVFQRAGLPVEVTAEFETWRRIRDSEGSEGWVLHSLLSGRRTALVTPWDKNNTLSPLYSNSSANAAVRAQLSPSVIININSCDGEWCRISIRNLEGFIQQKLLWGVYPGEEIK